MIVDIVHSRSKKENESAFGVFHLVNPTSTSWESLLPAIHAMYSHENGLETVRMESWVQELHQIKYPSAEDLESKPALKLMPFYESLVAGGGLAALSVSLDVRNTNAASATMRALPRISPDMMATWLNQWGF